MSPVAMKGKWAQGIRPRNFHWIIKDQVALCERPGGYGANHRRVRRQEEIIWIREQGFGCVISLIPAPHNLHNYDDLGVVWRHRPFGADDDPAELPRRAVPRDQGAAVLGHEGADARRGARATASAGRSPATCSGTGSSTRALGPSRWSSRSPNASSGRSAAGWWPWPPRSEELPPCPIVIQLRGLRALGICGALPEERDRPQPFEVDLDVEADLSVAGRSDELADTLDYGGLAVEVERVITGERFVLLERMAERIAEVVLADPRARAVTVTVRKLRPPVPVRAGHGGRAHPEGHADDARLPGSRLEPRRS